jgi:hypothetical protein
MPIQDLLDLGLAHLWCHDLDLFLVVAYADLLLRDPSRDQADRFSPPSSPRLTGS